MMNTTKILLYVNNYLYENLDNPEIQKVIQELSGVSNWESFDNDVQEMPKSISRPTEMVGIFNGISYQHYKAIQKGGVFLNAMLIGIMYDTEAWKAILTKDEKIMAIYLFVPYDVYQKITETKKQVSRQKYTEMDDAMKAIVESLNIPETITKH